MRCWLFLLLLVPLTGLAREEGDSLQSFLDQKDFFRLRTALQQGKEGMAPAQHLYYTAFVENAFNRPRESSVSIQKLLGFFGASLSDRQKVMLLLIQEDNYYKMGLYQLAEASCDQLMRQYSQLLDSAKLHEEANNKLIWHALSTVPSQEVLVTDNTTLAWKRDAAGLMTVPVVCKGVSFDFVFDTGANLSTITRSFAAKLGLPVKEINVEVSSATGNRTRSAIAVADSLLLGGILLKNVVFLVLPDEELSFPSIHYTIHAILGFPVIAQLKEIHIRQDGSMLIAQHSVPGKLQNLALDALTPVICLATDMDTLVFHFDTGAAETDLYSSYFRKHEMEVRRSGQLDTVKRGGAGGVVSTEVFVLPSLNLYVGQQKVRLSKVDVLTSPLPGNEEKYYGNIGQDLIRSFKEMVLNFDYMYVDFK